jgi:LPXTG-motif cell wall-anchored protein
MDNVTMIRVISGVLAFAVLGLIILRRRRKSAE